jgi:hypothetical protein
MRGRASKRLIAFFAFAPGFACSAEEPAPTPVPVPTATAQQLVPATLVIRSIEVVQTVSMPIFDTGGEIALDKRKAAPIEGKKGLLRVFYSQPTAQKRAKFELTLSLLQGASEVWSKTTTVGERSSTPAVLESTGNFEFDGSDFAAGRSVYLTVKALDGSGLLTRIPEAGSLALHAAKKTVVNLTFVPIRYRAEGQDLLPRLDAEDLAARKRELEDIFPTSALNLSVHEPVEWNEPLRSDGEGWGALLDAMGALRNREAPRSSEFYMALFRSAPRFDQYCKNGCVAGLAPMVSIVRDPFYQFGISAGWGGISNSNTIAHELGHNLGRNHAPCGGALGADREYPYQDGIIGKMGFSVLESKLKVADDEFDLMGYCDPKWISDYTYAAMGRRVAEIQEAERNEQPDIFPKPERAPTNVSVLRMDAKGTLQWSKIGAPSIASSAGEPMAVEFDSGSTRTRGEGRFVPFDHLPGGYLTLPSPAALYDTVHIFTPRGVQSLRRR